MIRLLVQELLTKNTVTRPMKYIVVNYYGYDILQRTNWTAQFYLLRRLSLISCLLKNFRKKVYLKILFVSLFDAVFITNYKSGGHFPFYLYLECKISDLNNFLIVCPIWMILNSWLLISWLKLISDTKGWGS